MQRAKFKISPESSSWQNSKFLIVNCIFAIYIFNFEFSYATPSGGLYPFFREKPPSLNKGLESIHSEDLLKHVKYLASDELEGRRAGEEGERKAGEYIAKEFERYGLLPMGDEGTFFQSLEVVADVRLGKENSLEIVQSESRTPHLPLNVEVDYIPLGFSSSAELEGELVFCGYGISAEEYHYDDYANVEVKGKIAVLLRHEPQEKEENSVFRGKDFTSYANLPYKVRNARDHGAIGMILVNDPNNHQDEEDELVKLGYGGTKDAGIPAIHVKRLILEEILKKAGKDLKEIQKRIDQDLKPESFEIEGIEMTAKIDLVREKKKARNVVGILKGKESHETIVLGAHYDHLGYGGEGSLDPDRREVHNGADDNASGTAGVLELAEAFSLEKSKLKRNIVFVAFTGEELGLLGSNHYVDHPPFPLEETIAMINLDMIGRSKKNRLMVSGVETAKGWKETLKRLNRKGKFEISYHDDGYGPSDHTSFYAKKIPVLFFFSGTHEDYHRPSDDWEKINTKDLKRVTQLVYRTLHTIQKESEPPMYVEVPSPSRGSMEGGRGGYGAFLGVIPEFGYEGEGVRISGVRAGSPAEKAGLLGEDVIFKFDGKKIRDLYDLTYSLQSKKAGDLVELVVLRGRKEKLLTATLGKRGEGGAQMVEPERKGGEEMSGLVEIGKPAPGFTLKTIGGNEVNLGDYKGKKNVILYFYPMDDTPGCTKEACSFRDNLSKVQDLNAVVLGVSVDGLDSHAKFKEKFNLNFPLLSDEGKEVSKRYGVLNEEKGWDRRVTFIIDKDGIIRHIFPMVQVDGHTEEVLKVLENL